MTLFDNNRKEQLKTIAPLAARMRPKNFKEFIGHQNIVGESSSLRKSIQSGKIPSMILWGPPGTGKTTLANLIANEIEASFYKLNAIGSGVSEIREIISKAKTNLGMRNQRSIIFIDEIHRFNKSEQQEILSHVEDGTVILIGATTENPSFEIVSQLLSRVTVIVLKSLTNEDLKSIIRSSIQNENGLGKYNISIDNESVNFLIQVSSGDARIALNTLEMTINSLEKQKQNSPIFIARRMVIFASEDIGIADSNALLIAISAMQSVQLIGMPESQYTLSHATIYLSKAPKNNSAKSSINAALKEVKFSGNQPVPLHLRNASTNLEKSMGYGKNYIYPHNEKNFKNEISNFPENLKDTIFFTEENTND